jgi:hypothetical protein
MMRFQFALESLKQRKGICSATGKSGQNFVMIKPAHFTRAGFGDYRA